MSIFCVFIIIFHVIAFMLDLSCCRMTAGSAIKLFKGPAFIGTDLLIQDYWPVAVLQKLSKPEILFDLFTNLVNFR